MSPVNDSPGGGGGERRVPAAAGECARGGGRRYGGSWQALVQGGLLAKVLVQGGLGGGSPKGRLVQGGVWKRCSCEAELVREAGSCKRGLVKEGLVRGGEKGACAGGGRGKVACAREGLVQGEACAGGV